MDAEKEYHDPDYNETSRVVRNQQNDDSEPARVEKIKKVITREFQNDLLERENDVMLIDERLSSARKILHRLRYSLVSAYYNEKSLQLSKARIEDEIVNQSDPRAREQVTSILRHSQKRIHPSLRKLLGKQTVDLNEIIMIPRESRTRVKKNYSAMIQTRNYTKSADSTKSLRPETDVKVESSEEPSTSSQPKKVPRHIEPKVEKVLTLDEVTRNKTKHRYRIIVGNTSKYTPAESRADPSTHKWLLYVRSASGDQLSPVVRAVTFRLHHSYAPHHVVHLHKPPYHISRRGWGEFPAKIELHFALPQRNRPATVEHMIKLDRNYTGLQTLGAETIIDVWLYSTQEMLQYEHKDEENAQTDTETNVKMKEEPETKEINEQIEQTDNWMDFFITPSKELNIDDMLIKPDRGVNIVENMDIGEEIVDNDIEMTVKKEIKEEPIEEINTEHIEEMNEEHIEEMNAEHDEEINEEHIEEMKPEPIEKIKPEPVWTKKEDVTESLPSELLNRSPNKRIMKYVDGSTGKIYYLEMDSHFDLSAIQEIEVFDAKGNVERVKSTIKGNGINCAGKQKRGMSLLKPEVKNLLTETKQRLKSFRCFVTKKYAHIRNDHCYLGREWAKCICFMKFVPVQVDTEKDTAKYESVCASVRRMSSVKAAVNYLLRTMPIIDDGGRDRNEILKLPFTFEDQETFWKLDFAKRRNIEWSRAKTISEILKHNLKTEETIWRPKQILIYSRLHGHHPIRLDTVMVNDTEWSWSSDSIKDKYPKVDSVSTLTFFNDEEFLEDTVCQVDLCQSDDEVDVVNELPTKRNISQTEESKDLTVLPVVDEEDRLRFLYVERMCADIGLELRNEDVGNGYSYSAVHAVLLSAMKSFAEDIIRNAHADKLLEDHNTDVLPPVWLGSSRKGTCIRASHVYGALRRDSRIGSASNDARDRAAIVHETYTI